MEATPPHQQARRGCSYSLCQGLEGGEEGAAAWARIQEAVSCQWCEEWGFQQQIFTGAHFMAGAMLILD